MRIVVDTNAFVAAGFNPGSASARILEAVRAQALTLVWDDATRAETRRVLTRIPRLRWEDVAPLFRDAARFDDAPDPSAFGLIVDPSDRKFAALASAAGAVLVTSDDHLLAHAGTLPCPVETPGVFARRLDGTLGGG
ncbi:PIN domain-containing protein [Salinarimonas sp. NSM]|uniref:PIN domain-containing protein n=1 Tax=Salinarimonas sp. NSM TaxID=3458003 RepID=UPI00403644AD